MRRIVKQAEVQTVPLEEIIPQATQSSRLATAAQNNSLVFVLVLLLLVATYLLGVLTTKVQSLEQGKAPIAAGTTTERGAAQVPNAPQQPNTPPAKVDVAVGHLPLLGDKDAKVTLIEFSDFQCPFCRSLYTNVIKQLKKEYIDTGKVKLAYRYYPLDFHPAAQKSAEAAECANDQSKFWEFHDKVYDEQEKKGQGTVQYTVEEIKQWAAEIGINAEQFNTCLDSGKYAAKVTEDLTAGQQAGVQGTPATFVNGQLVSGAQPYATFKAMIDEELKK